MAPMNDNTKTTSDANAPVTANASTNSIVEPRICRIDLVGSNIDIAATNLVTDAYYMLQESGNMLPTTPGGSNIWENIQNTFVKYTGTDGGVTNWLVTPKGDVGFYRVRGVKE